MLERQSDGTEYKKTHRRPGLRPNPAGGAHSASANPLSGGEGQEPHPRSREMGSGLASPTPTPKLVPTPLSPPRTPLGSIQRSPDSLAGGNVAASPSPRTSTLSRLCGFRTSSPSVDVSFASVEKKILATAPIATPND